MQNDIITLMQSEHIKFVKVKFFENNGGYVPYYRNGNHDTIGRLSPKSYNYKVNVEADISIDDMVVVETDYGPKVALVEAIEENPLINRNITYRWIVCKVSFNTYHKVIDNEREAEKIMQEAKAKKAQQELRDSMIEKLGEEDYKKLEAKVRL